MMIIIIIIIIIVIMCGGEGITAQRNDNLKKNGNHLYHNFSFHLYINYYSFQLSLSLFISHFLIILRFLHSQNEKEEKEKNEIK
jgi:Na+/proline symporter